MTTSQQDFTEANRQAFNDLSTTYTKYPWQRKLSAQVKTALLSRLDWLDVAAWKDQKKNPSSTTTGTIATRQIRLLDYACGPGTITSALAPYVTSSIGIDIAENMVEAYNAAAQTSDLDARAFVGNFLTNDGEHDAHEELRDFDLVVVAAALHHMDDPALGVKRLAERAKRGDGVVCVVDFMPFEHSHFGSHSHSKEKSRSHEHDRADGSESEVSDSSMPQMAHTIKQHGFTREDMAKLYAEAGLEGFAYEELEGVLRLGPEDGKSPGVRGFVARGTRV